MRDRLEAALAGRYSIIRELGRGGMATVWLGTDLRHDRPVAIKILHSELAGVIGSDRFLREVKVTARLQHPNIVPVLDSGVLTDTDGTQLPWYSMPYVSGESLRARLQREQHLPVEEALHITEEIASALQGAHKEGIIHRDVKPENILLSDDRVYVVDFGIAKALIDTGAERLTSTGLAIGTPSYMSPEQASASTVDARTDQYSLATVLYEMLAGEPPFTGPTPQSIIARRFAEPARKLRPVRSTVPLPVEGAVLKALERVPADRYPDVGSFAKALRSDVVPRSQTRLLSRGRRIELTFTAGVILAAALAGWMYTGRNKDALSTSGTPEALAFYAKGIQAYDKRTPAGIAEAVTAFSAAIQRDSSYTDAWTGLARTYSRAFERRFLVPGVARDSVLRLAVVAVDRALSLEPNNADAWLAQSLLSRNLDPTDLGPALHAARESIRLDSTKAPAWQALGVDLAETGDMDGALTAWRRSVRVNPKYTQGLSFVGLAHYWRRNYDSAIVWADSSITVDPNYLLGRTTLGQATVERGDYVRASAAFEAARRLSTEIEVANALAGTALSAARAGRRSEARSILLHADSLANAYPPAPLHTAVFFAEAYAALGDSDAAIAWLRRYSPREDLHFQLHIRCDPPFDAIMNDPRFRALLLPSMPRSQRGCQG